eukprot:CAMPEP_0178439500 /NCGR_PEP_ID=MMETSP0689_2-20121128/36191_1 /TAXON_ID=160604 /ORGANISM="Amphidinium massartii, Strain CS-259" /LENGTH=168 /DNA_ID=CAMNT_0020062037 /DNA_START=443 /DNA_END=949 /DNA_ORIENTATION=-
MSAINVEYAINEEACRFDAGRTIEHPVCCEVERIPHIAERLRAKHIVLLLLHPSSVACSNGDEHLVLLEPGNGSGDLGEVRPRRDRGVPEVTLFVVLGVRFAGWKVLILQLCACSDNPSCPPDMRESSDDVPMNRVLYAKGSDQVGIQIAKPGWSAPHQGSDVGLRLI